MTFHHAKPHKGSPMKSGDFCAVRGKGVGEYSYDPRPLHRRNPEGYADSVRNACINFQVSLCQIIWMYYHDKHFCHSSCSGVRKGQI